MLSLNKIVGLATLSVVAGQAAAIDYVDMRDKGYTSSMIKEALICREPEHAFLYQEGWYIAQSAGEKDGASWYNTMHKALIESGKCRISQGVTKDVKVVDLMLLNNPTKSPGGNRIFVRIIDPAINAPAYVPIAMLPEMDVRVQDIIKAGKSQKP